MISQKSNPPRRRQQAAPSHRSLLPARRGIICDHTWTDATSLMVIGCQFSIQFSSGFLTSTRLVIPLQGRCSLGPPIRSRCRTALVLASMCMDARFHLSLYGCIVIGVIGR
jgi:hypothetical protein